MAAGSKMATTSSAWLLNTVLAMVGCAAQRPSRSHPPPLECAPRAITPPIIAPLLNCARPRMALCLQVGHPPGVRQDGQRYGAHPGARRRHPEVRGVRLRHGQHRRLVRPAILNDRQHLCPALPFEIATAVLHRFITPRCLPRPVLFLPRDDGCRSSYDGVPSQLTFAGLLSFLCAFFCRNDITKATWGAASYKGIFAMLAGGIANILG